jgi:ParB-like chromosome segregation protein Spo0J
MANPVRPLTEMERTALRESIDTHGRILVPIIVDQHGEIIDGHHRKEIADELGLECPVVQLDVDSDIERMAMAIECNTARRQLNLVERSEYHVRLRAAGWSYRRIAEVTGVNPTHCAPRC